MLDVRAGLYSQCETTQNHEHGTGASFFGYSKLYGQVPGGQAEYLRVPFADFLPVKVPDGPADDRFLFLSDVLPTAWQGLQYADVPDGGTLLVLGAGPIGDMAARIGVRGGHRVISVDRVPERLARGRGVRRRAAQPRRPRSRQRGRRRPRAHRWPRSRRRHRRGRHGGTRLPAVAAVQKIVGLLPDAIAEPMMKKAGIDRLAALHTAFDAVRRGGTVSISGVYGGAADPMPMMQLFDKQMQLRMGQANVRRWTDDMLALLDRRGPVRRRDLRHPPPPARRGARRPTRRSRRRRTGQVKVVFRP